MSGFGATLKILTRRYWVSALAWLVPLWAFLSVIPTSYQSVYPDLAARTILVDQMRDTMGTRVLFGILPETGSIGQLVQWETGTFLIWGAAIMTLTLSTAMTRRDESEGLVEVLRGAGAGPLVPFAGAATVTGTLAALLGLGCTGILLVNAVVVDELTVSGAWALGGVITVVGWTFAGLGLLLAQFFGSVGGARGVGAGILFVSFCLRVGADEANLSALRWLTPLGWRDLVRPFDEDRWLPLVVGTGLALILLICATWAHARREHLAALLPERPASRRTLKVRGPVSLSWRVGRGHAIGWTIACATSAALFGSMAQGMTETLSTSTDTAEYIQKIVPDADPVVQYLSLLSVVTVVMVVVAAAQLVTAWADAERRGLVEQILAQGVSRASWMLSTLTHALALGALLLALSAGVLAATVATQIEAEHAVERAFVFTVSQFPGVVAVVGLGAALVGWAPRLTSLVWVVPAWSFFATYFGSLVNLPDWAIDLSVLGHHMDVTGEVEWVPAVVLLAVGMVGVCVGYLGWAGPMRRNIPG